MFLALLPSNGLAGPTGMVAGMLLAGGKSSAPWREEVCMSIKVMTWLLDEHKDSLSDLCSFVEAPAGLICLSPNLGEMACLLLLLVRPVEYEVEAVWPVRVCGASAGLGAD
eukprot:scaffold238699_cov27-Prasinocladus_malaysianus.AAC.1